MKWCMGLMVLMIAAVLAGCGDGGIDENKPIGQVAAEAAKMDKADLQEIVGQYEPLIEDKVVALGALKDQLKELSISELVGEKSKTMKAELKGITTSLDKLKEQLAVYTKALSSAAE